MESSETNDNVVLFRRNNKHFNLCILFSGSLIIVVISPFVCIVRYYKVSNFATLS